MSNYLSPQAVKDKFEKVHNIGEGADGKVVLYKHRYICTESIAVKYPRSLDKAKASEIGKEIRLLRRIQHQNIITMFGWDYGWKPYAPAAFLELCLLGDVFLYRLGLMEMIGCVPEETMWKLFVDMSRALDFMHNEFQLPYVHGDFKPDNILVQYPPGWAHSKEVPCVMPTFKLADFSRTVQYVPKSSKFVPYLGTWCYAPPPKERNESITPASDIFSLGATLQFLATGKDPQMDLADFKKLLLAGGFKTRFLPPDEVLTGNDPPMALTKQWPVVYRPLTNYGTPHYSKELDKWYRMCLRRDIRMRITSQELGRRFAPLADRQIALLTEKTEYRALKAQGAASKSSNMLEEPGR